MDSKQVTYYKEESMKGLRTRMDDVKFSKHYRLVTTKWFMLKTISLPCRVKTIVRIKDGFWLRFWGRSIDSFARKINLHLYEDAFSRVIVWKAYDL